MFGFGNNKNSDLSALVWREGIYWYIQVSDDRKGKVVEEFKILDTASRSNIVEKCAEHGVPGEHITIL